MINGWQQRNSLWLYIYIYTVTCMECDYRRVLDCWPDLLDSLIQPWLPLYMPLINPKGGSLLCLYWMMKFYEYLQEIRYVMFSTTLTRPVQQGDTWYNTKSIQSRSISSLEEKIQCLILNNGRNWIYYRCYISSRHCQRHSSGERRVKYLIEPRIVRDGLYANL
jgi:hypothetical protein